MDWNGKRVLVTGGSAGIGEAIARQAIARGAKVAINGRDAERLVAVAADLGAQPAAGDVGTDAEAIVAWAAEHLDGLDVLVNNAGWGAFALLTDLDPAEMEAMWRTNVLGAALVAKACVPHLEAAGGGAIVNIASTAAGKGFAGGTAYASTKFALAGMTQCWQAELRPKDIRVVQVNPSEVQTAFGGAQRPRVGNPHKLFADDVAHAVITALEMDDRGYVPELTIHATNPWKGEG